VSLHRVERPDGSVGWRVRWRDGGRGSAARSRTFDRKADAAAFEDEVRRRRRLGELGIRIGSRETLDQYVTETWVRTHAVTLAPTTAKTYAVLYDVHIGPYLGAFKLSDLTPELIARWQADRIAAGAGRMSVRKSLTLLGAILQLALESERIGRNPVRTVRKVARPPKKEVRPLSPATVEAMRAASGVRDATLISVLAYAGLRPGEALELRWRHVGERTLTVYASKTRQRRSVRLLTPLKEDLRGWRRAAGDPDEAALVFPSADGGRWSREAYSSWASRASRGRKREDGTRAGTGGAFGRAALAAGAGNASPYTLRHSFCSLLLHEGRSVIYVARQMGHDAKLTLGTYGHVIDELDDAPRVPAEDAIRAARSNSCVTGVSRPSEGRE
jgi:integrase